MANTLEEANKEIKRYKIKNKSLIGTSILGIIGMGLVYSLWQFSSYNERKNKEELNAKISQLEKAAQSSFNFGKISEIPEPINPLITYAKSIEIASQERSYLITPVEINDICYCKKRDTTSDINNPPKK